MPELKASGDLFALQGNAGFETGIVHGRVAGDIHVGVTAAAELCHGIEIDLGAEASAEIQAMLALLLPALRAEGHVFASLGVTLRVQVSPDVFDKVGFTADAEAQAQLSAGGRLAIALDFHSLAELARDQMSDLAYDIFIAFLNELMVEAGVWGKASFAAMAHAHLEVNGTLASDEDARFVITAGADVGWGGGTGWDFYAGLQFKDVKRFYHTTAHLITDEVVTQARQRLSASYRPAIELTDLLLPTVLVASFELGQMTALELVRWAERADQNAAPFGRAFRRQLQRFIIDKMAEAAGQLLERYLDGAVARVTSDSVPADQRDELQETIQSIIDDLRTDGPLTVNSLLTLIARLTNILEILFPNELRLWRQPLTTAWCAVALGESMRAAGSHAAAGLSVGGVAVGSISVQAHIEDFPQPPDFVREELNAFFGLEPSHIEAADAVDYLVETGLVPLLEHMLPDVAAMLDQLSSLIGGTFDLTIGDLVEAALRGSAGGDLSDTDLYLNVRDWMRTSIETEILGDLIPAFRAVVGEDEDASLYLDEVVAPCFLLTTNFVFTSLDRLVSIATRPAPGSEFYDTFRLALSALVWRIFSRNVVVISDILTHHAVIELHTAFNTLHQEIASNPRHPFVTAGVDLLSTVSPNLQTHPDDVREAVHGLFADLVLAGGLAFGPNVWTVARRTEMRHLMIRLLESIDTGVDYEDGDAVAAFFTQLRECYYIPDLQGLQQLGALQLAVTTEELAILFERVVPALEIFWLRLTLTTVRDMATRAHETIEELAQLARAAWDTLQYWVGKANSLLAEVQALTAETAAAIQNAAELLRSEALQDAIIVEVRNRGLDNAADLARSVPGFDTQLITTTQGVFLTAFLGVEPLLRTGLVAIGTAANHLGTAIRNAANLPDLIQAAADDAASKIQSAVEALGIPWPQALSLNDVTAAAHQVVTNLASFALALESALDQLLAERAVRLTADEAETRRLDAQTRWQADNNRHADLLIGPLQLNIQSPHPLTGHPQNNWLYPREVPVMVEVIGASASFVRADNPQRILLAVNGQPITITANQWEVDEARKTLLLRHTLTVSNSALRDGMNTLEVSIVDGAGQQLRERVSFAVDTTRSIREARLEVAGDLSQFDAPGNDHANASEEYVALRNTGDQTLVLTDWRIEDRVGHSYRFPTYELVAGSVVRVRTGSGRDAAADLHWGRNQAVWNNRGDAVYIIDADNVLRAEHVY